MPVKIHGLTDVKARLSELDTLVTHKAHERVGLFGAAMAVEAKAVAPWTDRTTDARRSIHSDAEIEGNTVRGYLAILVYYGVYLEGYNPSGRPMTRKNHDKYKIIWRTITRNRPMFLQAFRELL